MAAGWLEVAYAGSLVSAVVSGSALGARVGNYTGVVRAQWARTTRYVTNLKNAITNRYRLTFL